MDAHQRRRTRGPGVRLPHAERARSARQRGGRALPAADRICRNRRFGRGRRHPARWQPGLSPRPFLSAVARRRRVRRGDCRARNGRLRGTGSRRGRRRRAAERRPIARCRAPLPPPDGRPLRCRQLDRHQSRDRQGSGPDRAGRRLKSQRARRRPGRLGQGSRGPRDPLCVVVGDRFGTRRAARAAGLRRAGDEPVSLDAAGVEIESRGGPPRGRNPDPQQRRSPGWRIPGGAGRPDSRRGRAAADRSHRRAAAGRRRGRAEVLRPAGRRADDHHDRIAAAGTAPKTCRNWLNCSSKKPTRAA